ncbi:mitochondrial import inner membrane translocase subunit Tim29 [Phlebotomus argentipes]|uniref:mitochondrial import inner membrane translocase subunit Tim29 n=1 Tax=Phlebotomus argentipes TaxID=94469 RepID=UPI002892C885|nr:mitochondrial import inner membrane translocase subunit Tim29 [Phlebotomus argentipes]
MPFLTKLLRKSLLQSYQGRVSAVRSRLDGITFPQRLKGTIVEKWANYWRQLLLDYQEVIVNVGKNARDKPLKASIIAATTAGLYYCGKTNPDEESFLQDLRRYQNEMSLVHESLHNPTSKEHLLMVEQNQNSGQLRCLSLGVMSLMWLHDFSPDTATYRATCEYLQPEWSTFHRRIIDVGFLGQWWNFRRKMTNYDINY